jgi:hypothetical protein
LLRSNLFCIGACFVAALGAVRPTQRARK